MINSLYLIKYPWLCSHTGQICGASLAEWMCPQFKHTHFVSLSEEKSLFCSKSSAKYLNLSPCDFSISAMFEKSFEIFIKPSSSAIFEKVEYTGLCSSNSLWAALFKRSTMLVEISIGYEPHISIFSPEHSLSSL